MKLTSVHHPQVDTIDILAYTRMPPSYLYYSVSYIAASALCKNFVPTNESRCLSRSSTNSTRGSQILSSWFWSPSTKHLIKFLSGPYLFRSACIYSWHGGPRNTDLLRVFFMKCWLCIPVSNLEFLVIMTRILLWENVLRSLGITYPNSRTEPPS